MTAHAQGHVSSVFIHLYIQGYTYIGSSISILYWFLVSIADGTTLGIETRQARSGETVVWHAGQQRQCQIREYAWE